MLRDEDGRSPLYYAALAGNIDVIEAFVEKDADPESVDNNGKFIRFAFGNFQNV